MWRYSLPFGALAFALLGSQPSLAGAQSPPKMRAQKIANAMTAGPAEIARNATIKDWPAREGGEFPVLHQGSNGWVCLPDEPSSPGNDPMCLDGEWEKAIVAYVAKAPPEIKQIGFAYMLTSSAYTSNTDPFATGPTPDNQWHKQGPHVMILFPDPKMYEGLPKDPHHGGPYVMFKGTPYTHVMWPVASGSRATKSRAERSGSP